MTTPLTPESLAELRRLYSRWQETVKPYGLRPMLSGEYYAVAAAAVDALPALLDAIDALNGKLVDAGYRQGEDRAELGALRAMLAGRCLSDITHRDEEHRQSVCMLPEGHAPLMHDDCMGCTWTDADHWEPSAIDALADRLARVRALHFGEYVEDDDRNRCFECVEDWPCPTIRALDGGES